MSEDTPQAPVLQIRREFNAPVTAVYEAFTKPAVMRRWWGPQHMQVYRCEVDLRPGGAWCVGLLNENGEKRDVSGTFTQVDPLSIAFTWRWQYSGAPQVETLVSIEFQAISDERCAISLVQRTFDSEHDRDNHQGGWLSSFASLDNYLQQRGGNSQ